tara:strand:+ start:364 stop:564 length:201 start_codon:yes stop_codon:yes gene_type:complete
MEENKLSFEIEKDGDQFHSWCPQLPGCHSHGATVNQAISNLKDAVYLYLEVVMEEQLIKKSLDLAV